MFRHTMILILGLALAVTAVSADVETATMVRLTDWVEVDAPPPIVWRTITSGKDLSWTPYWDSEANRKVQIVKVGDTLEFHDAWGNKGLSVVTYLEPYRELRIAHEPTDGSYICQLRLTLEATGDSATTVTYTEQYTDESGVEDMEATASEMEAQIGESLAALARKAEANKLKNQRAKGAAAAADTAKTGKKK